MVGHQNDEELTQADKEEADVQPIANTEQSNVQNDNENPGSKEPQPVFKRKTCLFYTKPRKTCRFYKRGRIWVRAQTPC